MKPGNTVLLIFLLFHLAIILSCEKQLNIDNNDKKFPIELKRDTLNEPTRFYWDITKNSKFKSYLLVRSLTPIPYGLNPKISISNLTLLAEFSNRDNIEFIDLDAPFKKELHYKLYIDVGNRFIESQDVVDFQRSFVFHDIINYVYFDKDSTWVYLICNSSDKVILFDYAQNKVLKENILGGATQTNNGGITSLHYGSSNLLFLGSQSMLYKMNSNSLLINKTIGLQGDYFSLITNHNKLLFSTNNNKDLSFNVWNPLNFSKINSISENNYLEPRSLVLLDPNTNKIAEVSVSQIKTFNVEELKGSISNITTINLDSNLEILPQIISSKDYQYFIPDINGHIFDNNLNLIATINKFNSLDFSFSEDRSFLYVASVFNGKSKINKLNFPDLKLINEIEIPFFEILRIQSFKNSIVVLGRDKQSNEYLIRVITI